MMDLDITFLLIAILLIALLVIWCLLRNEARQKRQLIVADRKGSAPVPLSSTPTQRRALNQTYTIMGPTTLREVEEQIPIIDEHGSRRTLIRIRTLETVVGPMGPAEIERDRRHTLPGYGHVYPVSDKEYEMFHGRIKLRVDPEASLAPQRRMGPNASSPSEDDAERIGVPSSPVMAPAVDSFWRRQLFLLYAVFVVLPLAVAVSVLHSPRQPGPPFSPLTTAIETAGSAPVASESRGPASTPTLLREAQPMPSPAGIPPLKDRNLSASRSAARLALAISPWGTVYVNGKRKGISPPMKELRLAPGRYTVEIRNDRFQPYRESLDLRSVTKSKIAHNFNKTSKRPLKKRSQG